MNRHCLILSMPKALLPPLALALGGLLFFPAFLSADMRADSIKAKAYCDSGFAKAQHLKYEEAERDFRESILLYPANAEAHYGLAFSIGNQIYKDKARSELEKAVLLKPGYAEGHYFIGLWYATRDQGAEVERELRETIQLNPYHACALYVLGWYLDAHGRRKEARPFWERALRVEKDTANFHYIWKRLEHTD